MNAISIPKALLVRDINSYSEEGHAKKLAFHKAGKTFLNKLAAALGLDKSAYDLRSNVAGIAVSGEVTLHADHLYVQLSESCTGPGVQMLYRACRSRKDYSGLRNNQLRMADFSDEDRQSRVLQQMLSLFQEGRQAA